MPKSMHGYTSHLHEEVPEFPVIGLFLIILAVTFSAEVLIMWLLPLLLPVDQFNDLQFSILDALLLSVVVCIFILPLLFFYKKRIDAVQSRISQQLQALNQHASVSIADAQGAIFYANIKFCDITGYSLQELYGQNHRLINSGYHPKEFFTQMWQTLTQGKIWQGDLCNRNKNGGQYWVRTTIVPITDVDGHPIKYISMRTDITSQKLLEHAALKSEEWLHTIMDNLGDGIYTLDSEGRLTYFNAEAERLLGWRLHELKGKLLHNIIHHHRIDGEPLPIEQCPITLAMKNNQIYRSEDEIFFHKNGQVIPISISGAPLLDEGKLMGSVASFRDVRLQQNVKAKLIEAKEAAEEASRVKADFLSTMSHEIRTPLNGVIGMTDLLLDTSLNAEQLEFAKTIKSSARALLSIINDILDFSKIEAGQLEIEQIQFSLQQVLEGSVDLVASKAYEKGLSLMSFVDPAIPALLVGDPARLRQILLNFLSNAIKFTSNGDIVARAHLISRYDQHVHLRLEVIDNGIGISPEIQQRLFKPFSQADSSTTRKYGGTGLGLSISKRLAGLMNGEIGVDSAVGNGSVFWVDIDFPVSEEQPARSQFMVRGKRVLLAGDKAGNRALYLKYFYSWGLRVDVAESVPEIITLLNESKDANDEYIAALITQPLHDTGLLDTLYLIHQEPGFDTFPVMVCQATMDLPLKTSLFEAGAEAVLVKPVKQSALFDAIVNLIDPDVKHAEEVSAPLGIERVAVSPQRNSESGPAHLILLAEDNVVNQKVAVHLLNKMGYAVHVVNNGNEALQALQNHSYALILMDCQMPLLDGFETTHAIRQLEAENKQHIPIIAMTANAMQGDRERCLEAGMDDYVTKPIVVDSLAEALKSWMPDSESDVDFESLEEPDQLTDVISSNSEPAIEIARLRDLFGDDDEVIAELLQVFWGSLSQLKEKLMRAITDKKPTVKALAHELKGSSANVGALCLNSLAVKLEMLIADEQWDEINELWLVIDEEIRRIKIYIRNLGAR